MFWLLMSILMITCMSFLGYDYYRKKKENIEMSKNEQRLFWTFLLTFVLFMVIALPVANHHAPAPKPASDNDSVKKSDIDQLRQEMNDNFKALQDKISSDTK